MSICRYLAVALLAAGAFTHAMPAAVAGSIGKSVADHYVTLAAERYEDATESAIELQKALGRFVSDPSPDSHAAAKAAWITAHRVYSHTEVLRFGNPNVDAWEGKVNAWPLDEGLIDYVSGGYAFDAGNPYARWNFVASNGPIEEDFIAELQEGTNPKAGPQGFADFETNVATGFHAIEFLLWGQDHNNPPKSAGQRPYTDYVRGDGCTNGYCLRRGLYLRTVAGLLVRNLRIMVADWKSANPRQYGRRFSALPVEERLRRIIEGMGKMSGGELAGERLRVALLSGDQEEEQNCFSDTTHYAIHDNALGIQTLYFGIHRRQNGRVVTGASLSSLVRKLDPALDVRLQSAFKATMARARELVARAEQGEPFDRMILSDNQSGNTGIKELIGALKAQTAAIEVLRKRLKELATL